MATLSNEPSTFPLTRNSNLLNNLLTGIDGLQKKGHLKGHLQNKKCLKLSTDLIFRHYKVLGMDVNLIKPDFLRHKRIDMRKESLLAGRRLGCNDTRGNSLINIPQAWMGTINQ